ncbi:MAG: TetR/AcrR family transcriptional regulator [Sporichthyaceae bacterium]
MPEAGRRDAEDYFLAAYHLLGQGGQTAVTVASLCDRVGATKGSFYYHFVDFPDFVARFARRWQAWLTAVLDGYAAEPDPLQRLELMVNSHFVTVTGPEPAIRAWAHSEPAIAAAMRAVDAHGARLGRDTFGAVVGDEATGEVLSHMAICAMVGLQQLAAPVDHERFVRVLAMFLQRCLHVDSEFVRIGGRPCVKVLGSTGVPVPRFVDRILPPADDSAVDLDEGVRAAVAAFAPTDARGAAAYFRAARELLGATGPEAVTVHALCDRLGVTKGSFHHHFGTMNGFMQAWAAHWGSCFAGLLDACGVAADPLRQLTLLHQATLTHPHPIETAWRAMARDHPAVRAALAGAERRTVDQLAGVLTGLLGDANLARPLAEFGLGLAVGTQQVHPPLDATQFAILGREWDRRCVGLCAEAVLVDGVPLVVVSAE